MLVKEKLHEQIITKWKTLESKRPLPRDIVRKLQDRFRVEFSYNTNSIEGNTLSLRETQFVIEEGMTISGKSLRDVNEVRNHPEALKYIENLSNRQSNPREADILTLHSIIMRGTIDTKYIGTYRKGNISITGSRHIPPPNLEVPKLMDGLLYMINNNPDEYWTVELAGRVLHQLVWIHPFQDGNGRLARLVTNLILLRRRYVPINFPTIDKRKYFNYLEKADNGEYGPTVNLVAQYVNKHLDIYLDALELTDRESYLSLQESAKRVAYSSAYLRLLVNKGSITATKHGRDWRIKERDLLKYFNDHREGLLKRRRQTAITS